MLNCPYPNLIGLDSGCMGAFYEGYYTCTFMCRLWNG